MALLFGILLAFEASPASAFALSLLFGLHPIHTEVVASLVGRADLLATGFALAASLIALRARAPRIGARLLVAGLFLASGSA